MTLRTTRSVFLEARMAITSCLPVRHLVTSGTTDSSVPAALRASRTFWPSKPEVALGASPVNRLVRERTFKNLSEWKALNYHNTDPWFFRTQGSVVRKWCCGGWRGMRLRLGRRLWRGMLLATTDPSFAQSNPMHTPAHQSVQSYAGKVCHYQFAIPSYLFGLGLDGKLDFLVLPTTTRTTSTGIPQSVEHNGLCKGGSTHWTVVRKRYANWY